MKNVTRVALANVPTLQRLHIPPLLEGAVFSQLDFFWLSIDSRLSGLDHHDSSRLIS